MALTRITKGVIKPNENYDTHNINSTGIVTATGLNISGNASIGGVLTYEDVTSIDSVGIITARGGIDCNGDLDVDGHTNLDNVSIAGVSTFSKKIILPDSTDTSNGRLVFGATTDMMLFHYGGENYIDLTSNLNIRGSSSGNIIKIKAKQSEESIIINPDGAVELYHNNQRKAYTESNGFYVTDTGRAAMARVLAPSGYDARIDLTADTHANEDNYRIEANTDQKFRVYGKPGGNYTSFIELDQVGRVTLTRDVDVARHLDVDGHTNLDNVSIAGVTTFADGVAAKFGTDGDLSIDHNGSAALIQNTTGNLTIRDTNGGIYIEGKTNQKHIVCIADGSTELYEANSKKLETTTTGINVTGNVVATGDLDVDGHTNLDNISVAGVSTFVGNVRIGDVTSYSALSSTDDIVIGSTTGMHGITIVSGNTGNDAGTLSFGDTGSNIAGAIRYVHSSNHMQFNTAGTERLRIDPAGNLVLKDHLAQGNSLVNYIQANDVNGVAQYILGQMSSGNQDLYLVQSKNANLRFQTSGSTRWKIDGDPGHLIPETAGAVNIGSSGAEIGNVFIADGKKVFLGSDQDASIYHDGTHNYLTNTTGNLFVTNTSGSNYTYVDSNFFRIRNSSGNHMFDVNSGGGHQGVGLYYSPGAQGTEKLRTSATGITVTGEVAASQDYPNFRPTLDLNFAAEKKLDPRITYSRSGPASFVNEFGKVVIVGENTPRFDHTFPEYWDEGTLGDSNSMGESKGLLIEESRTNLYKNNHNLTTANDHGSITQTVNTTETTAPDGTFTATKVDVTGGDQWMRFDVNNGLDVVGVNFSDIFSTSVYMKTVGTSNVNVALDFGDAGNKTFSVGQEWKRYAISNVHQNYGGSVKFIDFVLQGDIYIWGLQCENGAFPTSYIPTNGTTATRGYEAVTLEGADFSDVFGTQFNEFSFVADYDNTQTNDGTNYGIIDLWGEATGYDNRIEWFKDNASPYHIETRAFGQGNALFNNGELSASSKAKSQRFATSWFVPDYSNTSSRRFVVSMGGEAVDIIPDNSGTTVPILTRMGIGCNPTRLDFSPGHLHFKRLMVYNKTLSDGQLQNLSAQ